MAFHVQRVHEGDKLPCEYCNSVFLQKVGLKKHLESKHLPFSDQISLEALYLCNFQNFKLES